MTKKNARYWFNTHSDIIKKSMSNWLIDNSDHCHINISVKARHKLQVGAFGVWQCVECIKVSERIMASDFHSMSQLTNKWIYCNYYWQRRRWLRRNYHGMQMNSQMQKGEEIKII